MHDLERTYQGTQLDFDELAELRAQREAEATAAGRRAWRRERTAGIINRTQAGHLFEPPRPLTDLQQVGKRIRGTRPADDAAPQEQPAARHAPPRRDTRQPTQTNPIMIGPRVRVRVYPAGRD